MFPRLLSRNRNMRMLRSSVSRTSLLALATSTVSALPTTARTTAFVHTFHHRSRPKTMTTTTTAETTMRRYLSAVTGQQPEKEQRLFHEDLNIIYDSKCNVCKLEIDFLARRDERRSKGPNGGRRLRTTDLETDYDPNDPANGGVSYEKGMAAIHAVTADGTVMEGVPVFRAAYELVGLGWLFRFTEWPILKQLVNAGYDVFAKYRTNVTRGSSLEDLVRAYEAKRALEETQRVEAENCVPCAEMKK